MTLLRMLGTIFLFPGNLALSWLNIKMDSDAGIFRSMINMIFWGIVAMLTILPFAVG